MLLKCAGQPHSQNDVAPGVNSARIDEPLFGPLGISSESAVCTGLFPLSLFSLVSSHLGSFEVTNSSG